MQRGAGFGHQIEQSEQDCPAHYQDDGGRARQPGHASAARPFSREHAAWPALNEQNQQHQHNDLAEHRAGDGLKELVDDAQSQRADNRTPQIADAAEHHDHETVDDVALAEIG